MSIEIERKFLVVGEKWRQHAQAIKYKQGYISTDKERTVRIRTIETEAYLTIKGKSIGAKRNEFEYQIPIKDAEEILIKLCHKPIIDKNRYTIEHNGLIWEIDEFFGENKGLIIAEVELSDENQDIDKPDWVGTEVTDDPKYYNANLIRNPFCKWSKK